jgi:dolichol-phosphate mannosyltransferase
MVDSSCATVIIPTLNEENNIVQLIDKIKKLMPNVNLIVSDDGSKDKTQELVCEKGLYYGSGKENKSSIILLDRSKKPIKGLTASVIDAINKCKTDFFVVIDADHQHPPEKILDMISIFKSKKDVELVIGNRIKIHGDWGLHRLLISETAYIMGSLRLIKKNFPKYDLMSGFFGGRTKLVKDVLSKHHSKFEHKGYKVMFDIMKYLPKDTKIEKVDYEFGLRTKGESKLDWKIVFYYFRSLFK